MPTVADLALWNSFTQPLDAVSRTNGQLLAADYETLLSPLRSFALMTLVPFFCYPLSAINLYGYCRCLYTTRLPRIVRESEKYHDDIPREYSVMKRCYDVRRKRMIETYVPAEEQNTVYVLSIVRDRRNEYIDDPNVPNTAYLVQERLSMKASTLFGSENIAWGMMSDFSRFLLPAMLGYAFHPAAQRFKVDALLVFQRRLRWNEVRHPITNFFRTAKEYQEAKHRINKVTPVAKDARPWHYKL